MGCLLQSLDLDDTKTITMEELAEGLRKQGSPIAQKELEARAPPNSSCQACFGQVLNRAGGGPAQAGQPYCAEGAGGARAPNGVSVSL